MKKILFSLAALLCLNTIQAASRFIDMTTGVTGGFLTPLNNPELLWHVKDPNNNVQALYAAGNGNGLYSTPSNYCGQFVSPSTQAYGNYTYYMSFTGQPCTQQVTSASFTFNYIGADNKITDIKVNGYSLGYSSVNDDFNSPLTQNVTISIPAVYLLPGTNTVQILVYNTPDTNVQGWATPTALLICGGLTINYTTGLHIGPAIAAAPASYCEGSPLTFTGSVAYNNVTNYYWEIAQCDQYGNYTNGYSSGAWYSGSPSGAFTFPVLPPCGNYYKVKLAVQNNCIPWEETSLIIFIECNPVVTISGGNEVCAGSPITLCANYIPSSNYSVIWNAPKKFSGQCTTVIPAATTTYTVNVTSALGCRGAASQTVNVLPNNPYFGLNIIPASGYFTLQAKASDQPTTTSSGYHYMYILEELSSTGSTIWIETNNPPYWWMFPAPTTFNDIDCTTNNYSGTVNLPTTNGSYPIGKFLFDHTYRITLGSWNDACSWKQSSITITPTTPHLLGGSVSSREMTMYPDYSTPDMSYLQYAMRTASEEGLAPEAARSRIDVFPNPGQGLFKMSGEGLSGGLIEVYDPSGRLVKSTSFEGALMDYVLDLSGNPAGMYQVNIHSAGKYYAKKIVLQ